MNVTVERIFKVAENKGVSLDFVNSLIGGYTGKMDKWKYGKVQPNFQEVSTIASYFNVSLDYLLGNIDTPQAAHRESAQETAAHLTRPPRESSQVHLVMPDGTKSRITVPPEKSERLRMLIAAAFPELMEHEEPLL